MVKVPNFKLATVKYILINVQLGFYFSDIPLTTGLEKKFIPL